jgi:hypothetical protein
LRADAFRDDRCTIGELHGSARGIHEQGGHAQERGLPCTVGSEERYELAGADFEGNAAECG